MHNSILIQSVWTVLAFVIFIGIVIWAWSGRREKDFDKAARMALDEDKNNNDDNSNNKDNAVDEQSSKHSS